ncbi:hypothetical protein FA15DRAFT_665509 [Coprinopsis marcescibilis]|uniref:Uncharacterized protein n=1 Tax=Coprinopsis marcescibilis TaxID=230819 RepID=A0A5C3L6B6_COPMA|nr:hypothetical protein FA15DRAFT_665509 [Coprinopsis marcescibilis]
MSKTWIPSAGFILFLTVISMISSAVAGVVNIAGRAVDLDKDIVWTAAKSHKGVPFEIGTFKNATNDARAPSVAALQSELAAKPESLDVAAGGRMMPPTVRVYWEVTSDDSWKEVHQEVKDIGIWRYALTYSHSPVDQYILYFSNSGGWTFRFFDQANDFYDCFTFFNGDHLIRYSSNWPTIVSVI